MNGFRPCLLNSLCFVGIGDSGIQELADVGHDRYEGQQVTKRNYGRSMGLVRLIFLPGSMTKANLFLIVQLRLIVGARGHVNDPLNKPTLYASFVLVVGFAVRAGKPL